MPSPVRLRRTVPLLLALGVLAAACSNGGSDGAATTSTTEDNVAGGPTTTGPLGSGSSPIPDGIRIEVLSSQPDRVTGDDARVRVTPPAGVPASELEVRLDDAKVTDRFEVVDGTLEGVVTGFIEGNNTLTASAGDDEAVQRVRAWPLTGPVFSGPHLPLLACSTEAHGLGAPTDADCSAPTKVSWRYIASDGSLKDLPDPQVAPTDLATGTIDGADVPLYVRYEQGVINRSVYEIASVDPSPGDDDPTGPGWNGKLLYRYGGGCGTTYGQGTSLTTAAEPAYLEQGYVVATATFNTFQVQCNDVLSAETTMMVKEHIIEQFGRPAFTIGEGASGGAIQLHLLAQNYPGLVNGAVAMLPFPDAISIAPGVTDCGLLLDYYGSEAGAALSDEQRRAINGHATTRTCQSWADTFLAAIDPTKGCDPDIPADQVYDPETNRAGVRCTLQDANRNQMGLDETTGFARRPLDNVGVQYGLEALNAGTISFDQFVDLNREIGGYDLDGQIVDDRHEADPEAVLHAYETGRVSMGGGDQLNIPIIDVNVFTDPTGDIHDRFRAFSLRERLAPGGDPELAPGFQIWTRDPGSDSLIEALGNAASGGGYGLEAVEVMDEWLTALAADDEGGRMDGVLRRTRPDAAVDNCAAVGEAPYAQGIDVYEEEGPCRDDHPLAGDPRIAAGAPTSGQVLKCNLKPVDPQDYELALTDEQLEQLASVFPQGVCDWSAPSAYEMVPATPDRTYEDVETPGQNA